MLRVDAGQVVGYIILYGMVGFFASVVYMCNVRKSRPSEEFVAGAIWPLVLVIVLLRLLWRDVPKVIRSLTKG